MAHESETQKFVWTHVGKPLANDADLKQYGVGVFNKILPNENIEHYILIRTDIRDSEKDAGNDKTVFRETSNQIDLVVRGTINDNIIDNAGTQRIDLMLSKTRDVLDGIDIQYDIRDDDFSDITKTTRKIITFNNLY